MKFGVLQDRKEKKMTIRISSIFLVFQLVSKYAKPSGQPADHVATFRGSIIVWRFGGLSQF